jgi:hypothetical protein
MPEEQMQETKASVNMEAFFTRQKANEGVKLDLSLPDGTPTEHWIRIRGVDSDQFREAQQRMNARMLELSKDPTVKSQAAAVYAQEANRMVGSLIISWSFPEPVNEATI